MRTKEELEKEINESADAYFAINGENVEILRKTELIKLFSCVFEYCKKYVYSKKNEWGLEKAVDYYLEIYDCVGSCIHKYNPEAGAFLHYFMGSIKFVIGEAIKKERTGNKKYLLCTDIAKDSSSILDREKSKLPETHEAIASLMDMEMIFDVIEREFCKKQDRVKEYVSALISARLYDQIKLFNFRKRYTFISIPIIKDAMKNRGQVPSQKEIAESFKKKEEDASRTCNKFLKGVRLEIEKMKADGKI